MTPTGTFQSPLAVAASGSPDTVQMEGPRGLPSDGPSQTRVDTLQGVRESGMCIGCGACVAADPSLSLEMDPERQSYRPSHASGELAASVCPAIAVDFPYLHEKVFPDMPVGPHGVLDSVWLAQSTDEPRNLSASSGGLIKELLHELLGRPEVDGIISLVHKGGIDFGAELVSDPKEIDTLPGSIYHALPFTEALQILRANEGRFVLIAIPCQLEGILTYIHSVEPHLWGRIHSTVGLLCGWQYTHHALRAICTYKGVSFDDLTGVSWRGGGPVGKLRLPTRESETLVSRRLDFSYQVAFDRSFNIPRCHLCVNHSNFLADIVVGDAWLPSTVFSRTGVSLIICRTPGSRELLQTIRERGRVVTAEVTEAEIEESQSSRVVFGDFAYAYQEYLARHGLPHPVMCGPNHPMARNVPHNQVESFHKELSFKLRLQAARRYRYLWWRKLTLELPALSRRYVNWFLVRLLRLKSITGKRREVDRSRLANFR